MDKIRVGVAGCGSVSEKYLPSLLACPFAEVAAVCDIAPDRTRRQVTEFGIPKGFSSVNAMLEGAEFDLLVNLTSMPAHYEVNKQALQSGKHVFSEKPFAPTSAQGKELVALANENAVQFWAAPNTVTSAQFRYMTELIAAEAIGKVYAAHACYGHSGPTWGPWFYKKGGGCMGDLAVYNITTLTGLLGPAKTVTALAGTGIAERVVEGERIEVTADDNVMLLLDHGNAVFSHIQAGFVYGDHNYDRTIELIGTKGVINLLGWDWAPQGVQVRRGGGEAFQTRCAERHGYVWQSGAAHMAECLVTGEQSVMTIEHALHVVEVMAAAYESAATGRRIPIESAFSRPLTA
jgi:predicted dehydrogenase